MLRHYVREKIKMVLKKFYFFQLKTKNPHKQLFMRVLKNRLFYVFKALYKDPNKNH